MTEKQNLTMMVIGAHHDDNELVGGTMLLHKQQGWRVVSVTMTDGRWANGVVSDDNIAVRDQESREAMEILGAEPVFLRFTEGDFQATPEARLALIEDIRKYQPDVLITHPPQDYHSDHMNVSRVVLEAVFQSGNGCMKTKYAPFTPSKLYYCDAWFVPFEPDEYIDISEVFDRKIEALSCHKSQLPAEAVNSGDDMVTFATLRNRVYGIESGVRYAEAFRLVPRLCRQRLSRLLGG